MAEVSRVGTEMMNRIPKVESSPNLLYSMEVVENSWTGETVMVVTEIMIEIIDSTIVQSNIRVFSKSYKIFSCHEHMNNWFAHK